MRFVVVRFAFLAAVAAVVAVTSVQSASAASCSSWRATCVKRAKAVNASYLSQCEANFNACLSSGCFTEGAKFGGATHCQLTKK